MQACLRLHYPMQARGFALSFLRRGRNRMSRDVDPSPGLWTCLILYSITAPDVWSPQKSGLASGQDLDVASAKAPGREAQSAAAQTLPTINHQPSTINHQPSTINHQPSIS